MFYRLNVSACTLCPPRVITYLPEPVWNRVKKNINFAGRQFDYPSALEIIQDEEYLEDADFDDIRRQYIVKKIETFNMNLNNLKGTHHKKSRPKLSQRISNKLHIDDEKMFHDNEETKLNQKQYYRIRNRFELQDDSQKLLHRQKRTGICRVKCVQ